VSVALRNAPSVQIVGSDTAVAVRAMRSIVGHLVSRCDVLPTWKPVIDTKRNPNVASFTGLDDQFYTDYMVRLLVRDGERRRSWSARCCSVAADCATKLTPLR
jgi:hypothetical protein